MFCDNRTRHCQEINACNSHQGRGSPEIDLFEAMYMRPWPHPVLSSSFQVAPGISSARPVPGHAPNSSQIWYENIEYGSNASLNTFFYGTKVLLHPRYQTDALSANVLVDDNHFSQHYEYRLEWEPPSDGEDGHLRWYMDGELTTGIRGESLHLSHTEIPSEPMYLLINTAISKDWAFPDAYFKNCMCKCYDCSDPCCRACALPEDFCEENLPAHFEIDYVWVVYHAEDGRHT